MNFTAAWCITCLVNERVALRSPEVAAAFARKGVVYLKADWTHRDSTIAGVLDIVRAERRAPLRPLSARGGRRPGAGEPTVLPQILSEGTIIEAIEKIDSDQLRGGHMPHEHQTRRAFLANASLLALSAGAAGATALPRVAWASAKVGEAAPPFTAATSTGPSLSLGDYRGKIVVLEWTNHDCPYVRKHYESGNMQALQREHHGQGVIWLTVISSAPGTQGYVSPAEANELTSARKAAPTAVVLIPRAPSAGCTAPPTPPTCTWSTRLASSSTRGPSTTGRPRGRAIFKARRITCGLALEAVAAGQPVKTPVTRAYGCTVKYG